MMNDFRGKNAWFSSSVSKECKQVWMKGGGGVVHNIENGDYIFADNPSASDMSRFYKSRLFLDKGVLPFRSVWLLDTKKNILDYILCPEDFKETASPQEQAFEDEEASPTFHTIKEFTNSHSQDSESSFCLDDYEILDLPNHEKSKASPNEVNGANSLEWVCEDEKSSSRNSYSKGSENGVHLKNDDDDSDANDDQKYHQSSSKKSNIPPTVVKESNCLEWTFETFEDEGSSPVFYRLRDFRSISAIQGEKTIAQDDKTLGPDSLNSKTPKKKSRNGKGGPGLEELTKVPIPSQNGHFLEKVNTNNCQGALSPVIPSHENTKTSASSVISTQRGSKEPACSVISSQSNKKSASVKKKAQCKNSKTRQKEDRHYMVKDEEPFDETDSISLTSFTEQDQASMLPSSVSLRELEIPTHVFHSSMHDGFTRLEDIEIPEGLKLQDFFSKDEDEETVCEFQVYLKYPTK